MARPITLVIALAYLLDAGNFVAADEPSHLSSDPRVNDARALIDDGRYNDALRILRPLAPGHLDRTDVLFLIGLAALGAAQLPQTAETEQTHLLDEAIAAFHTILVDRPSLVRVRLELARAFFLKGDDELSRKHFERVLAGRPHPAIAANIQRYLQTIKARRRWSGYFGVTLAPDSNINTASDERTIYIFGLPFHRDAGTTARSGIGIVLWGGGEYQLPLNDRLRIRTGADVTHTEYDGREFDQTFLSVHIGPRWLVSQATEISLLGSASRHWSGGNPHWQETGFRFESEHRLSRQLTAIGRVSWHQRRVDQNKLLNGPHAALSLGTNLQATPTMAIKAFVGYTRARPNLLRWRNSGHWARLSASLALPNGFTTGIGGELRRTWYKGDWTPLTPSGTARKDRTAILRVSAVYRGYTVFGFSPKLVLVNEARKSNAQAHDYRRNRAELHFVKQF